MPSTYRVAADIGATWSRFRLLDPEGLTLAQHKVPTDLLGEGADFAEQLDSVCVELGAKARPTAVVLAVAGPVQDGRARVTNGRLALDQQRLCADLECPVQLCNDFFALAHGLNDFQQLLPLGPAPIDARSMRVVLGPGSGLGMALCVPALPSGSFRVLPSEGGHAPLAARTSLEQELMCVLRPGTTEVTVWETVLSGPGLLRLYQALATVRNEPAVHNTSEAVTRAALSGEDALATATLEQFGAWLGDCAASLALTTCAEGGVYLVGDLSRAIADLLVAGPLRARFDTRDVMSSYAEGIAFNLVLDPDPGLIGVTALARMPAA